MTRQSFLRELYNVLIWFSTKCFAIEVIEYIICPRSFPFLFVNGMPIASALSFCRDLLLHPSTKDTSSSVSVSFPNLSNNNLDKI